MKDSGNGKIYHWSCSETDGLCWREMYPEEDFSIKTEGEFLAQLWGVGRTILSVVPSVVIYTIRHRMIWRKQGTSRDLI
jgi:hypothetical protein